MFFLIELMKAMDLITSRSSSNLGETPACAIQTTCTYDKLTEEEVNRHIHLYGGKKLLGPPSDKGKDQEIDVRECYFNSENIAGSSGNQYVWAAVTFLDIFQRCQHSWVLLRRSSETDYTILSTNTTDPYVSCGLSQYGFSRSIEF
jgi:hypothetical protein